MVGTTMQDRARRAGTIVLTLCLGLPLVAAAAQLSMNGVPIGKVELRVQGLEGQTFEKCTTMKVEQNGDVNVDCPGYDIKPPANAQADNKPKPLPPPPGGKGLTKHYWLVTEQPQPGLTQFDVDLYVNDRWVKRFKSEDTQVAMEITKNLALGKNSVLLSATKRSAEDRKSTSEKVFYRFVIGEGDVVGGSVRINVPLIDVRRTAAEGGPTLIEKKELEAK